jgi:hypothetical protein
MFDNLPSKESRPLALLRRGARSRDGDGAAAVDPTPAAVRARVGRGDSARPLNLRASDALSF